MSRTRIKICGITRLEDATFAVDLGVDALGFVFYEKSPRYIKSSTAQTMIKQLPAFVNCVGLFVNATARYVETILAHVAIDTLQFHGNESEAYCCQFNRPYLKAIRMNPDADIAQLMAAYASANAILLDTYQVGTPGGTGKTFNWNHIPSTARPIILAGGLNAENVGIAIDKTKPFAVDVSGGVETEKGIKNAAKMSAFERSVNRARR